MFWTADKFDARKQWNAAWQQHCKASHLQAPILAGGCSGLVPSNERPASRSIMYMVEKTSFWYEQRVRLEWALCEYWRTKRRAINSIISEIEGNRLDGSTPVRSFGFIYCNFNFRTDLILISTQKHSIFGRVTSAKVKRFDRSIIWVIKTYVVWCLPRQTHMLSSTIFSFQYQFIWHKYIEQCQRPIPSSQTDWSAGGK